MPIRYTADIEHIAPDEADTTRELVETMRSISEKTFADGGRPLRSVHAKSHGLLTGELIVPGDLPADLAQGLFAKAGRYQATLRLSTAPGDLLPDSVSSPRGAALKIDNFEGERLPGSSGARTQDFVMATGKAFSAPNPKKFLGNLKLLAATTDRMEGVKKLVSGALRGLETALEAVGGESPTLIALGGQPAVHILGQSFFTQVPLRFGDYIAKLSLVPVSPELTALTDAPLSLTGKPNPLRDSVIDFFQGNSGEWELRAQLCTDTDAMPIEDASVVWPEDQSPYVAVARFRAPPQEAWSDEKIARVNEGLSFSPWHGIEAHRPLGGIMRARKPAYEMSARFRADHGAPVSS